MKNTTILQKLNTDYKLRSKLTDQSELYPLGNQRSFNGKTQVFEIKIGKYNYDVLKSFKTFVAIKRYNDDFTTDFNFNTYSNTTTKHIKSFLGRADSTMKQLEKERAE